MGLLGVVFVSILFAAMWSSSDCYDPLDPFGNITVTFDVLEYIHEDDAYVARVTIQNYYSYRHVEKPGWNLGWTWTNKEVIWSMKGAFATHQGDCSSSKSQIPHCCMNSPVISDQPTDTLGEIRSENCCHGGLLSAWAIDPDNSFSSFEMKVGMPNPNSSAQVPVNLTLMAPGPGYTCSPLALTEPTHSLDYGGQRDVQVFLTWKSECTYSTFLAYTTPVCCVALSTFYNPTITSCPTCSCGCKNADPNAVSCIRESYPSTQSNSNPNSISNVDMVQCTDHMCPVKVHWHVKNNYMDHWRVKLTVSNYNYNNSYSDWNVLVHHPGLTQSTITYSFNSSKLHTVGFTDEIALFWGIEFYNKELLNAKIEELGSVTTDILLRKDMKTFTLRDGWAFPRALYFNGEMCAMPPVDIFPMLPNTCSKFIPITYHFFLIFIFLIFQIM